MNNETRIKLSDSPSNMIIKLAEGNPGSIKAMMQLIEKTQSIDPYAIYEHITYLLLLDMFGIYNSRIWKFYKDVCGENLLYMIAIMRAVQIGKLSENAMHHAIDNYGEGININSILKSVQTKLPNFGK